MERTDFWQLTVSHWPNAVEANVRPVEAGDWGSILLDEGPQYYRSHHFNFINPPSRQDFLDMCRRIPWTQCWEKNGFFKIIEQNDWPLIEYCKKASSVDLMHEGKEVGRLRVDRQVQYVNQPYPVIHLPSRLEDSIVNRRFRTEQERRDASYFLMMAENKILERLLTLGYHPSEADIRKVMVDLLNERKKELCRTN